MAEDKNRFTKSFLDKDDHYRPGYSIAEEISRNTAQAAREISEIKKKYASNAASGRPIVNIPPPQQPQREQSELSFWRHQDELARDKERAEAQAKQAQSHEAQLKANNDANVDLLESLEHQGQLNYMQEMAAQEQMTEVSGIIAGVGDGISVMNGIASAMREDLKKGMGEVNDALRELARLNGVSIEEQGRAIKVASAQLSELLHHGTTLTGIHAEMREQSGVQRGILQGVDRMNTQQGEGNEILRRVSDQISGLHAVAERTGADVGRIRNGLDDLNIMASRIHSTLMNIERNQGRKFRLESHEKWEFGEEARRVGDSLPALHQFAESKKLNPTNTLCDYSLGLMCIELGALNAAYDFFGNGLKYARGQSPEFAAVFLLRMGNIVSSQGDVRQAQELFEEAAQLDKTNAHIGYAHGLAWMRLGGNNQCMAYLGAILNAARKNPRLHGLVEKIRHTPEFAPVLKQLGL